MCGFLNSVERKEMRRDEERYITMNNESLMKMLGEVHDNYNAAHRYNLEDMEFLAYMTKANFWLLNILVGKLTEDLYK